MQRHLAFVGIPNNGSSSQTAMQQEWIWGAKNRTQCFKTFSSQNKFFINVINDIILICRDQKSNATFLDKVFGEPLGSWTSAPKIVDIRTKSVFSCSPSAGEKLFDPWASGRKGQECPQEIRTNKFMFMLFFSSLIMQALPNSFQITSRDGLGAFRVPRGMAPTKGGGPTKIYANNLNE